MKMDEIDIEYFTEKYSREKFRKSYINLTDIQKRVVDNYIGKLIEADENG